MKKNFTRVCTALLLSSTLTMAAGNIFGNIPLTNPGGISTFGFHVAIEDY